MAFCKFLRELDTKLKIYLGILAIFLPSLFIVTLCLDNITPPARLEHKYLFPLFNSSSGEANHFLRLERLSSSYFFVAAHGKTNNSIDKSDKWIIDDRTGEEILIDPKIASEIVITEKRRRSLPDELPIFLIGCNTGSGEIPFAQKFSQFVNEDVYAVNGWLVVDQFGFSRTAKSNQFLASLNFGNFEFRRFRNGQEIK